MYVVSEGLPVVEKVVNVTGVPAVTLAVEGDLLSVGGLGCTEIKRYFIYCK